MLRVECESKALLLMCEKRVKVKRVREARRGDENSNSSNRNRSEKREYRNSERERENFANFPLEQRIKLLAQRKRGS